MSGFEGKRLLILGCGYLGKRVAAEALAKGMRVVAVSRNLDTLAEVEALGVDCIRGMVDEEGWHGAVGSQVDFALNCVSSAGGGLAGYRQSYIGGNASLVEWARAVGFEGQAIYTSSVSVYGDAGGEWVGEDMAPDPANERGVLLRESESVFLAGLGDATGVVLRLAGLYGPGRHMLLNRLISAPAELPGWGDYFLNLVRIEDVAAAIWACWERESPLSGVFSVVDDEPVLKESLVAWLSAQLGFDGPRFTGLLDGSGRSSRRLGESGRAANRRISNAAFKSKLGWQPRFKSFREGFGDLIAVDRS